MYLGLSEVMRWQRERERQRERKREAQTLIAYQCTRVSGAGVHTVRDEAEDCHPNKYSL